MYPNPDCSRIDRTSLASVLRTLYNSSFVCKKFPFVYVLKAMLSLTSWFSDTGAKVIKGGLSELLSLTIFLCFSGMIDRCTPNPLPIFPIFDRLSPFQQAFWDS